MRIEKNFSHFKKLVYETSILVERFWLDLRKTDFAIIEIMGIGKTIVDNYLILKSIYEMVITVNPEHREIVVMSINLY